MLVFPSGSDASIQHRPIATMILAGLCAVATLTIWILWPRAAVDGAIYVVHADEIRALERLERELPADPEQAAERIEADFRREWAGELRREVGLDGAKPKAMSAAEKREFRSMIDEAVSEGQLDGKVRDELAAALPAVPEVSETHQHLAWLDEEKGPITAEQAKQASDLLARGKADATLTAEEHSAFSAKLAALRVVSPGFLELLGHMQAEDLGKPLSVEERDRLVARAGELVQEGGLIPAERAEFDAYLAKRPVVSEALAQLEQCTAEEVPWFMFPFGAWSGPWTWLVSTVAHCHWRDALLNIGLLWSFGLVVEGKLGWRRFLPVFAVGILGTGVISLLAGLTTGIVLPMCGAHDLVGFLAGICLVWAPMNDIHYRRWLGVTLGEFEVPIWLILAFSALAQLVIGLVVGFPVLAVLLMALGYPLLGAATGTVLLRRGLVATDGWDIYALWKTRNISTSERNQRERERRFAESGRAAVPAEDSAALTAAAAEEFTADLAAGKGGEAYGVLTLMRQRWPAWQAEPAALDRLAKLLWKEGRKDEAGQVAEQLADAAPATAGDARIMLAAIAIEARKPATASRHLDALPEGLRPAQLAQRDLLRGKAAELVRQGVSEVEFI